jgi:hypothetical protein
MFKKCLLSIVIIVAVAIAATACKLPTRDEMRQPDYGSSTEADIAQNVIDDIGSLYDDIREGVKTGSVTRAFTESQLTALIAQNIEKAADANIGNVLINIEDDVLLMAADLPYNDETKEVVAEFTFAANGTTMAIGLGDFTWGGLQASIIPAVKSQFEEQLNNGLQAATGDSTITMSSILVPEGATVDSIVLVQGQMTITGTVDWEVLSE